MILNSRRLHKFADQRCRPESVLKSVGQVSAIPGRGERLTLWWIIKEEDKECPDPGGETAEPKQPAEKNSTKPIGIQYQSTSLRRSNKHSKCTPIETINCEFVSKSIKYLSMLMRRKKRKRNPYRT